MCRMPVLEFGRGIEVPPAEAWAAVVRRRSWPPGVIRALAAGRAVAISSTARRATTLNRRLGGMDSTRLGHISTFWRPRVRTASRRNVDFLFWDSASVTWILGRRTAMGRPGKPAPEPKSRRVLVSTGIWRAAKRLSPKWRRTISSGSRMAVRLVRAFHLRRRSRYAESWGRMAAGGVRYGMRRVAIADSERVGMGRLGGSSRAWRECPL